jgi:general secretion pathway protein A
MLFLSGVLDQNAIFSLPEITKGDHSRSQRVTRSESLKRPFSPIPEPNLKSVDAPDRVPDKAPNKLKNNAPAGTPVNSPDKASIKVSENAPAKVTDKTQAKAPALDEPGTVRKPVRELGVLLEKLDRFYSRKAALKAALDLWGAESEMGRHLDGISDDYAFFRLAAKQNGLLLRRITGHFNAVKKLDLPAILAFRFSGDGAPVYLALCRIDDGKITLRGGEKDISIELEPDDLESYWLGTAYLPWKNFLSLKGAIPLNSPKESVITLKMLLRDIGFNTVEISPFYDENTRQAVKHVQGKYGIHTDGVVGSTTKIALYNEKKFKEIPHISRFSNSNIP